MTVAFGFLLVALSLLLPCYLVLRLIWSYQAVSRARQAVAQLTAELAAANRRTAERYRVHLPGRHQFEDELSVSNAMLAHLEGKLINLTLKPLSQKLTPSFVQECNQVTAGAKKKFNDLQDEVFWAQFPLNSDARNARYRDNTED